MDNTASDNKNTIMFAFLGLLVKLKIFRKVKVGFLEVGHTHEDIDQFFSVLAKKIKNVGYNIFSLEKLRDLFAEGVLDVTNLDIEKIPDVDQWMHGKAR